MRIVAILLFLGIAANANAQQGYSLEAWFWHDHISTKDSLYTQDFDVQNPHNTIPLHFSEADFRLLDSVASAVGFWNLPDTLPKNCECKEHSNELPSINFSTPSHKKNVTVVGQPLGKEDLETIRTMESAIENLIKKQSRYNTLPARVFRI